MLCVVICTKRGTECFVLCYVQNVALKFCVVLCTKHGTECFVLCYVQNVALNALCCVMYKMCH